MVWASLSANSPLAHGHHSLLSVYLTAEVGRTGFVTVQCGCCIFVVQSLRSPHPDRPSHSTATLLWNLRKEVARLLWAVSQTPVSLEVSGLKNPSRQSRATIQGVTCTDCPDKHCRQPSAGGDLSLRSLVSYVIAPKSFLLHSQLPSSSEHDASLTGSLPTLIRGMKCS